MTYEEKLRYDLERAHEIRSLCDDLGISVNEYRRRRKAVPCLRKIRAHNAANPIQPGWRGAVVLGGWTGRSRHERT